MAGIILHATYTAETMTKPAMIQTVTMSIKPVVVVIEAEPRTLLDANHCN